VSHVKQRTAYASGWSYLLLRRDPGLIICRTHLQPRRRKYRVFWLETGTLNSMGGSNSPATVRVGSFGAAESVPAPISPVGTLNTVRSYSVVLVQTRRCWKSHITGGVLTDGGRHTVYKCRQSEPTFRSYHQLRDCLRDVLFAPDWSRLEIQQGNFTFAGARVPLRRSCHRQ